MSLCLGPRTPATVARAVTPRFNHVKCPPSAALAPFVQHYWVTPWNRRALPSRTAASLLDPCVHLHVQDGRAEVIGVVRGTYRTRIEGVGCVVGVQFRPGGFYPFVSRPVVEWTDRIVDATEVFGVSDEAHSAWARELSAAASECRGGADELAAMITAHLDPFLKARLPARVSDLVRASGRSERTLHRLFARYVGATPSWVIRRHRLRTATERLTASPPADVRAVAWEFGYADQAHFIRDFRATIGVTPGAYVQSRV
jgi:AraC-like DNA-binding protein